MTINLHQKYEDTIAENYHKTNFNISDLLGSWETTIEKTFAIIGPDYV